MEKREGEKENGEVSLIIGKKWGKRKKVGIIKGKLWEVRLVEREICCVMGRMGLWEVRFIERDIGGRGIAKYVRNRIDLGGRWGEE